MAQRQCTGPFPQSLSSHPPSSLTPFSPVCHRWPFGLPTEGRGRATTMSPSKATVLTMEVPHQQASHEREQEEAEQHGHQHHPAPGASLLHLLGIVRRQELHTLLKAIHVLNAKRFQDSETLSQRLSIHPRSVTFGSLGEKGFHPGVQGLYAQGPPPVPRYRSPPQRKKCRCFYPFLIGWWV